MRRRMMVLVGVVVASLLVCSSVAAAPAVAAPTGGNLPGSHHIVRPGQTLYSIGRMYGVSAWAIASANHLRNPNRIYAGQWLLIPRGGPGGPGGPGGHPGGWRFHVVRCGETMLGIGRLYHMNPWVIASANGIYNLNRIYAGQRLVIPG